MISTKDLKTDNISLLIIDEADEMLKRGFKDQVKDIFMNLIKKKCRSPCLVQLGKKKKCK